MAEEKTKKSVEPSKEEKKDTSAKKEIVIKETEEDIVLGNGKNLDPEDFKEEIKREAEKGKIGKILLPLFVFLLIAGVSAAATYYYAKPERSIQSEIKAEDKIETPPVVEDKPAENPDTPTTTTPTTPVTPAPTTDKKEITYTVQEGDTMSGIANKYDMTSTELATYNGLTDANTLRIGQVLKIPVK